jgi:orotidine-5'-phosphate decarboxylase
MSENFADRLLGAIGRSGSPVCVGLDPVFDRLPAPLKARGADEASQLASIGEFCRQVLPAVAPIVPAVKLQSAYFEVYRAEGVGLYFDLVRQAKELGLLVIGDLKRNDIGTTAAAYAQGHLAGPGSPDAVTVNGYLGADGIEPFAEVAAREGKGLFVLVRTSNPSAALIQDFTDAAGLKFYEHMARQVAALGDREGLIGQCHYSSLGAVVGATYPDEARRLRKIMPRQVFLVPGYGAQGATADDCAAAFDAAGTGAIVNASRSVIYAYKEDRYKHLDWKAAVREAASNFAADIRNAVPK